MCFGAFDKHSFGAFDPKLWAFSLFLYHVKTVDSNTWHKQERCFIRVYYTDSLKCCMVEFIIIVRTNYHVN